MNLQQRSKWTKNRRDAKMDDIVLLQDDLAPRNQWNFAKITEVFPGADGRVRKVIVMDSKGARKGKPVYLERPIHKTVSLLESY